LFEGYPPGDLYLAIAGGEFAMGVQGNRGGSDGPLVTSGGVAQTHTTYQVDFIYDKPKQTAKIYVDGELKASGDKNFVFGHSGTRVTIGAGGHSAAGVVSTLEALTFGSVSNIEIFDGLPTVAHQCEHASYVSKGAVSIAANPAVGRFYILSADSTSQAVIPTLQAGIRIALRHSDGTETRGSVHSVESAHSRLYFDDKRSEAHPFWLTSLLVGESKWSGWTLYVLEVDSQTADSGTRIEPTSLTASIGCGCRVGYYLDIERRCQECPSSANMECHTCAEFSDPHTQASNFERTGTCLSCPYWAPAFRKFGETADGQSMGQCMSYPVFDKRSKSAFDSAFTTDALNCEDESTSYESQRALLSTFRGNAAIGSPYCESSAGDGNLHCYKSGIVSSDVDVRKLSPSGSGMDDDYSGIVRAVCTFDKHVTLSLADMATGTSQKSVECRMLCVPTAGSSCDSGYNTRMPATFVDASDSSWRIGGTAGKMCCYQGCADFPNGHYATTVHTMRSSEQLMYKNPSEWCIAGLLTL